MSRVTLQILNQVRESFLGQFETEEEIQRQELELNGPELVQVDHHRG